MSQTYEVFKGTEPIGGRSTLKPNRKFEINAKDFAEVQQGVPIRLAYGRFRSAGVQITPIFGFRSEQVFADDGKGSATAT